MNKFLTLFCLCFAGMMLLQAQTLTPTDKLALLDGVVTNYQGKPLAKEIIMFKNEKTGQVIKVNTDDQGKFQALVPVGVTYALKYKNFTIDMDYTKMTIPPDKEATYNVQVKIQPPKEIVLDNVYFDTGKASLKPASGKALNDLVEVLKMKSKMKIEIQGHTDNAGDAAANMKLSQARAEAVKKYLTNKGISADRVIAKGFGQERPVADNATEAGRSKNRRTSLKVLSE